MSYFISICEDMQALLATGAVSEDSPYRGSIDGRSGAHVQYSPDGLKSMIVLTSKEGLEALELLPYITVATPEEIFDHLARQEIDGVLQYDSGELPVLEIVDGDPDLLAQYLDIYDYRIPNIDDEGNETPRPKLFAVPGGQDMSHIL